MDLVILIILIILGVVFWNKYVIPEITEISVIREKQIEKLDLEIVLLEEKVGEILNAKEGPEGRS